MEKGGLVLNPYAYSALIRCCFSGRAAAHPHNPSRARHWFSLYVSSWRNRGPLEPGIAASFVKGVGYSAAAEACTSLGVDLESLAGAGRGSTREGARGAAVESVRQGATRRKEMRAAGVEPDGPIRTE